MADTEHRIKEDAPPGRASKTVFHRHRKCITCCGVTVALVLALIVVVVILVFTVFKPKNPSINVDLVEVEGFSVAFDFTTLQFKGNITLGIGVTVKNPNKASFKFTNSTALLFYRTTEVGEIPIGSGNLKADSKFSTNLTATILADRFLSSPNNLTSDLLAGELPFVTTTNVQGRINFLNIYKKHATASSSCNTTIFINGTTGDLVCDYKTTL